MSVLPTIEMWLSDASNLMGQDQCFSERSRQTANFKGGGDGFRLEPTRRRRAVELRGGQGRTREEEGDATAR
jgi:hypothetical protein